MTLLSRWLIFFICFGVFLSTTAQTTFTPQIVSNSLEGAFFIYAEDINGDSIIDLTAGAWGNHKVAWYQNDGNENFIEHVISDSINVFYTNFPIDLDNDSDVDLLATSMTPGSISWYENDGTENFTEHIISDTASDAWTVYAADINNDSDMDLVCAVFGKDKVAWFENDGDENFMQHNLPGLVDKVAGVHVIDLNEDGHLDILACGLTDKIVWYENDGFENFTEHVISVAGAGFMYTIDMDQDNDIDVVAAAGHAGVWYENDGNENFTEHIISNHAGVSIFPADFDNDGDIDAATTATYFDGTPDTIAWYENDGSMGFTQHILNTTAWGATGLYCKDIDQDSDVDILVSTDKDNDIIYFKNNFSSVGLIESEKISVKLFPNPSDGILNVDIQAEHFTLSVRNSLGQLVYITESSANKKINLNHLSSGNYSVAVATQSGLSVSKLTITK